MIDVHTREEFFNIVNSHLGFVRGSPQDVRQPDHVLWDAEKFVGRREGEEFSCQYFVCVKPITVTFEYWSWVEKTLSGMIVCFLSDAEEDVEYWGFTNEDDITIWLLKWSS